MAIIILFLYNILLLYKQGVECFLAHFSFKKTKQNTGALVEDAVFWSQMSFDQEFYFQIKMRNRKAG